MDGLEVFLQESSPTMSDRHYVHSEDEVQLAKILKESKPWLEQYGTTVIYGLAAVLAICAVVVYVARRPPATAAESQALMLASTSEDYQTVADEKPDSEIGMIARLRQGELSLRDAINNMFTDRKSGVEKLQEAEATFERLADRKDLSPWMRERVLAGLARVAETRCDGTDETAKAAVAAWEKVLKDFPDSKMFKELAEDRIKKLPQDSKKAFYAWFHQQDPKPGDDLQLPQDGPGKVPDLPSLSIPDLKSLVPQAPAGTESKPAESSATPAAPTDASTTPATGAPAAAAPATPAAADAKPAAAEGTATPADATAPPADAEPAAVEGTPAPAKSGE